MSAWARFPRTGAACAVLLTTLPALAVADTLPAGMRPCVSETNPDKRLACYDREAARLIQAPDRTNTATPRATPPAAAAPTPPASTHAAPAAAAAAGAAAVTKPAPPSHDVEVSATPKEPKKFSARVASVDRSPGEMTLHLDNGQVWEQADVSPGALSLDTGDTVTIEKQLGSYWLSSAHISAMRVRQKKP
jgi:hypothetical protein